MLNYRCVADMSRVVKDFEWLNSHYSELQKAYPNGKVVAYGKEFGGVYDEAKEKVGDDFMIDYILSGEPFVLEAELQGNRSKL